MFKNNNKLEKIEKVYEIKSMGIEKKHSKKEQLLLNDLSHRGVLTSSVCYTSCLDLYLEQIKENIEIYYTSIIEALSCDKRISNSLKKQVIIKIKSFISNQFKIKKPLLIKRMAAGGILNSQLSISF